jgi:integrase
LKTADVNFLKHSLSVKRTAAETSEGLQYGPPKTPASLRTIQLSPNLTAILADHIATFGTAGEFLFSSPEGHPIRWRNIRRRAWKPAVKASVGEPCNPHDLRRTHGALCIEEGLSMKKLQARLGHSNMTVTAAIYAGLYDEYDNDVADALNDHILAPKLADTLRT